MGKGGAGNYVKMVHNGIEYGDMQLIAEAYDILKLVGGLSNKELADVFDDWNNSELKSFLIEISANIFKKFDDRGPNKEDYLLDKVMDKTGSKGTGKWTCQDAADVGVDSTTMVAALNARYMASMKDERVAASKILTGPECNAPMSGEKERLIKIVKEALYASKICSYAQGMSLIQKKGIEQGWKLDLGLIASIWRGGCIIRAVFLDRITEAYNRNANLASLLVDEFFIGEIKSRQDSWREVVMVATKFGVPVPAICGSLSYYDAYRRARLPANMTQAQRDYFGAHTFQRIDDVVGTDFVHSEWQKPNARI